eukprot:SAG31_NODE_403_length_16150_cov_12.566588_11_plen_88_part_00
MLADLWPEDTGKVMGTAELMGGISYAIGPPVREHRPLPLATFREKLVGGHMRNDWSLLVGGHLSCPLGVGVYGTDEPFRSLCRYHIV